MAKEVTTTTKRGHKGYVQLVSALLLIVVGAALLILGFYAPPQGEILR